jgi:hypothetical protein
MKPESLQSPESTGPTTAPAQQSRFRLPQVDAIPLARHLQYSGTTALRWRARQPFVDVSVFSSEVNTTYPHRQTS